MIFFGAWLFQVINNPVSILKLFNIWLPSIMISDLLKPAFSFTICCWRISFSFGFCLKYSTKSGDFNIFFLKSIYYASLTWCFEIFATTSWTLYLNASISSFVRGYSFMLRGVSRFEFLFSQANNDSTYSSSFWRTTRTLPKPLKCLSYEGFILLLKIDTLRILIYYDYVVKMFELEGVFLSFFYGY